jgi:CSLREA domain-containing protein
MSSVRGPLAIVAVCLLALAGAGSAAAATFTVTTPGDNGDGTCDTSCSLRDAVSAANVDATRDAILLPAGTLRVERFGLDADNANGDLDVDMPLEIRGTGPGTTTIAAVGQDRVIDAIGADLTLVGLTLTGGIASGEAGANDDGGGIRAIGDDALELDRVVVRGNVSQGEASNPSGGGIFKEKGSLVVRNSAIVGNTARSGGFGGGIAVTDAATVVSLANVTIAQNTAHHNGGGVHFNSEAEADFAFTTVIENEAGGVEGAISVNSNLRLRSSIVARNVASNNPNCSTTDGPASLGGNVGSASCGFTLPTDVATEEPLLAPLGGIGVPVAEPLPGSPALDRGIAPCPATDARGVARPQGGACDAGAAERPVTVVPIASTPAPQSGPPSSVKISGLTVSKTKFRAGPRVVARPGKGKQPVGTTIAFQLSGAAMVKATVVRQVAGRRVGGKCLAATPARKGKPRCMRFVIAGRLATASYPAGRSSIAFSGRVGGSNLKPGRYKVELAVPSSGAAALTPLLQILP